MRMVSGAGTDQDRRVLAAFGRPSWIPRSVSYDVAAALSQLHGTPASWAQVRFVPSQAGEPWAMIVTPKGSPRLADGTSAYDQIVLIPGGGGPGTGAREVLDLFFHPEASGVSGATPGWGAEVSGRGEALSEPSVGYGERSEVLQRIDELLAGWKEAA